MAYVCRRSATSFWHEGFDPGPWLFASACLHVNAGLTEDLENSVLTFFDVCESWDTLGQALADTVLDEDGLLPALVVATGDYNNGYVAGYNDAFINQYLETMIERMKLQLGGIDTVWVSGNNDNGYVTGFTNASKEADLGLDEANYYYVAGSISGTGIIYDSRAKGTSAESSTANENLIVIGINYEDLGSLGAYSGSTNGHPSDESLLDYGSDGSDGNTVYAHLSGALANLAKGYDGELVLISTHAGLHTLGVDADSAAARARAWGWRRRLHNTHNQRSPNLLSAQIRWLPGHALCQGCRRQPNTRNGPCGRRVAPVYRDA